MVDQYGYKGLSKKAKEHAITKLRENPSKINEDIENFRNSVKSKPHLDLPTDSNFLLKFLRVAKFDCENAEAQLDNFCTLRGSVAGILECFDYINVDNPMVKEFLEKALLLPLGRNGTDDFIVLIRFNLWNPETISFKGFLNLIMMSLDLLVEDEEMQIYGLKFIHDLTNISRNAMAHFSNPMAMRNINRILHESHLFRLNGEIFYNDPELFDINYRMYTFYKDEKRRRQVFRVKGNIKDLAAKVPGIEKVMPKEYGGQGGRMGELAAKWKNKFNDYFKYGDPRPRVYSDESKRPKGTSSYLSHFGEYVGPTIEMELFSGDGDAISEIAEILEKKVMDYVMDDGQGQVNKQPASHDSTIGARLKNKFKDYFIAAEPKASVNPAPPKQAEGTSDYLSGIGEYVRPVIEQEIKSTCNIQ